MNIDKSQSPLWVKVTIWVTVVAFLFGFVAVGIFQLIPMLQEDKSAALGAQNEIDQQYESTVVALEAELRSDPTSATVLTALASTYSQWAEAIQQNAGAKPTAADQTAFGEKLVSAKSAWEKAYKASPDDERIGGDYATSLYYVGDTAGAVKVAREVLAKKPEYSTVWYNLGQYLSVTDPQEAINAFEQAAKFETEPNLKKQAQDAADQLKAKQQ